jgi:hypothetical protein
MKKASLPLLLIILFLINTIQAQTASSLTINDTRLVNEPPNFLYNGMKADFKSRAVIGVPGEGTWSTNLTLSPWTHSDNSGGKNHQLNFNNGGFFYRNAYPLDPQWGIWRQILMENENGNIGIGTANPISKLDILGSIAINSGLINTAARPLISSETLLNGEIRSYSAHGPHLGDGFLRLSAGGGGATKVKSYIDLSGYSTIPDMNANIVMGTWGVERMRIDLNGNMGIGTSNPDEKLTVNGKIHAKEVRIDLNFPAPDYVFANDYKLKSLQEVEEFIKQNSHLPEIPSAKEIKKNGLMLAEMNMSLLKKIEELTLYTIEQNKKILVLEKQNEKFSALERRLEKMENRSK